MLIMFYFTAFEWNFICISVCIFLKVRMRIKKLWVTNLPTSGGKPGEMRVGGEDTFEQQDPIFTQDTHLLSVSSVRHSYVYTSLVRSIVLQEHTPGGNNANCILIFVFPPKWILIVHAEGVRVCIYIILSKTKNSSTIAKFSCLSIQKLFPDVAARTVFDRAQSFACCGRNK